MLDWYYIQTLKHSQIYLHISASSIHTHYRYSQAAYYINVRYKNEGYFVKCAE